MSDDEFILWLRTMPNASVALAHLRIMQRLARTLQREHCLAPRQVQAVAAPARQIPHAAVRLSLILFERVWQLHTVRRAHRRSLQYSGYEGYCV